MKEIEISAVFVTKDGDPTVKNKFYIDFRFKALFGNQTITS